MQYMCHLQLSSAAQAGKDAQALVKAEQAVAGAKDKAVQEQAHSEARAGAAAERAAAGAAAEAASQQLLQEEETAAHQFQQQAAKRAAKKARQKQRKQVQPLRQCSFCR